MLLRIMNHQVNGGGGSSDGDTLESSSEDEHRPTAGRGRAGVRARGRTPQVGNRPGPGPRMRGPGIRGRVRMRGRPVQNAPDQGVVGAGTSESDSGDELPHPQGGLQQGPDNQGADISDGSGWLKIAKCMNNS